MLSNARIDALQAGHADRLGCPIVPPRGHRWIATFANDPNSNPTTAAPTTSNPSTYTSSQADVGPYTRWWGGPETAPPMSLSSGQNVRNHSG